MRGQVALYSAHFCRDVCFGDAVPPHEIVLQHLLSHQRVQILDLFLDLVVLDCLSLPGLVDKLHFLCVEHLAIDKTIDFSQEIDVFVDVRFHWLQGSSWLAVFFHFYGRHVSLECFIFLQKVHFVVLQAELFLKSPYSSRAGVHLLPDSLFDQNFRLYDPAAVRGLLFLVDQAAHYLGPKFVDQLLSGQFFQLGKSELVDIPSAYLHEIRQVVSLQKSFIGAVEPLSALHLLKTIRHLVRIVLYHRLHLPNLRPLRIGTMSQEDIQLNLSILVLEDVVPVALDGGEKLEPALC